MRHGPDGIGGVDIGLVLIVAAAACFGWLAWKQKSLAWLGATLLVLGVYAADRI
jgi:hypothetical protein